jgi:hypothetical protein
MPTRKDVDPVEMPFVLGHVALVDLASHPFGFRIRLQGTGFEWWMGCDLTGRMLSELPRPELRDLASSYLLTVAESGAPWYARESLLLDERQRSFETLILPLASDDGTIGTLLAAVRCRK